MFIKIGFWDKHNKPIITTDQYLDGFADRIKEWRDSVKDYNFLNQYLENGEIVQYMGYSYCRVCGFAANGCLEIYYGNYIFPDGYLHYILDHHIEVSIEFQKYVLESPIPKVVNKTSEQIYVEMRLNTYKMIAGMSKISYIN